MKNKLPPFLAGVLTTALIGSLTVTALAASGQVSFNLSAIKFNGQQISAKGENYTLSSGTNVPASITYTDENGGGTTYLPAKRISELVGVEIGYDVTTGSVTIAGDAASAVEPSATPDATSATDYSDWTVEEEAAYQEFKAMWIRVPEKDWDRRTASGTMSIYCMCVNTEKLLSFLQARQTSEIKIYSLRNSIELADQYFGSGALISVLYEDFWDDLCFETPQVVGGVVSKGTSGYVSNTIDTIQK
ncbi:hypothetical protein SDC9_46667 [bioreactor metagenome]|uniref:Copper amine oxidase-like N-terminal domain-containing protein n=1 Tax=bioreactor metagenome TaxID=1076179 RepID=A0A644WCZ6_9ZZZZ